MYAQKNIFVYIHSIRLMWFRHF